MRLINTQTLAMEEFYSDIPPYAILSHRWETEEVTFKDYPTQIDPRNINRMKGLTKIRYCIEQARRDGLGYCWVDTCCIDKSSSAELSEAINSMYAWYRGSAVCYIYMADVNASRLQGHGEDGERSLRNQFRDSKWFTRGWTLQELLAPRTRIFYNSNWEKILDLDQSNVRSSMSLIQDVVTVSGISAFALRAFSSTSSDFSVARKMSWASKRSTTRVEDTAYCLMGIFDVNMPLLYGEGPKAFLRLQEEIIRRTNDHSIFCWSANSTRATYRGLLAKSPAEFDRGWDVRASPDEPGYDDISSLAWENEASESMVFGMTNRGLRITLSLHSPPPFPGDLRVGPGEFYARLNCEFGPFRRPYFLLLAHLGHGNFARVGVHGNTYCPATLFEEPEGTLKEIYVHQNITVPSSYTSPRVSKVVFRRREPYDLLESIKIVSVTPDRYPRGDLWIEQDFNIDTTTVDPQINTGPIATVTFMHLLRGRDTTHAYFAVSLGRLHEHRVQSEDGEFMTSGNVEFVDPPPSSSFTPSYKPHPKNKKSATITINATGGTVTKRYLRLQKKLVVLEDELVMEIVFRIMI